MKQRKMLSFTLYQLGLFFRQELPGLVAQADASRDAGEFRARLEEFVARHAAAQGEAAEQIRLLIGYDGREVSELSTGEQMPVRTLELLWQFLTGRLENPEMRCDLFIDLFFQFKRLEGLELQPLTPQRVRIRSDRWPTGLDPEVAEVRAQNRERMLHLLVQKIENRKSTPSRFRFEEGMTYEDKYRQVGVWWGDFLSLLDITGKAYDDEAIRSYILYSPQLVETYGNIRAWEKEDVVEAGKPNAAGWLLPDGHNIHRRYPEVAILIPDTMGRACGGLCASCQRMYDFQSERLNFEFESLRPKESWDHKLRRLMAYFEEDTQLRDILITGGDALMSQNKTLRNILEAVYRMACRKRKANQARPDGEKYAELQRVRLGSRLPAYLPMRIDDQLVEVLKEFREKASAVGVKQFVIQTHFQSPLEVTPEAREAIRKILSAGWLITNQLVYTVAASRRGHTTRLRQVLNSLGVVCYYTFSVKGFGENYTVFTPNSRSMQEQQEEKLFGRMTAEQTAELDAALTGEGDTAGRIRRFMKKHRLPFLATDRSVLNLPAIGKSMTFRLVGITAEGKRILRFDHDRTRRHSPIIDRMGEIYIVENKSVAAYLRQLEKMGEDAEDYASIWGYTHGQTEPRFGLYVYPDFPFGVTDRVSNLELE